MKGSILKFTENDISKLSNQEKQKADTIKTKDGQQKFQLVIDKLNAAVFEWNTETKEFYFSEAYKNYAISKVNPEDILNNKGPRELVFTEDLPEFQKFINETNLGKPEADCTLRLKMTDGTFKWCKMIGLYYKDKANKLTKVIGIIIDINEDHEKSFMLNQLLNQLPGGVAIFKLSDKIKCTYFNDGFAALSDRTHKELEEIIEQDKFLETVIPASDLQQFYSTVNFQSQNYKTINFRYRYLKKNGEIGWIHISADRLKYEDGCPVYYCIFTKPSEESYLFQNIVNDSAIGVFVAEKQSHKVIFVNSFLKDIYKIPDHEYINGKNINELVSKNDYLITAEEIEKLKSNEFTEYHRELKNQKYFRIKAKALLWNNVDSYILYVFDETVEHKQQLELQNLLDNVPAGIGIYYFENGVMHQNYLNNTFYSMISDTRENHLKRLKGNFWDGIHPDDVKIVNDEVSNLMKGNNTASFEFRNLCGNGKYLWVKIATRVIERTPKRITVYASYTDISESIENRKLLEKTNSTIRQQYELEVVRRENIESRSKATTCFNASKNSLLYFKFDDSFTNKVNTTEINTDCYLNKMYSSEDKQKTIDFFTAGNILDKFSKGILEDSLEFRSFQNDELVHWIRADSNYVQNPTTNDILSYTSFFDVDEEKKNHFAAESVVDDEIDYVVLIKIKTNIARLIRINPKFDKPIYHTNFDFSLLTKNKVFDLIFDEDKKPLEEFVNKKNLIEQLNKNKTADFTYRIRAKDGSVYRKKARAFYLDETKEDVVFVRRDITDLYKEEVRQKEVLQKAVDEANKANQAKSTFLSNMSHDMRTPLNGILGETNLALEENNLSPKVRDYLNEVLSSGKFLLSLINDVLDMSKIEKGTIELNPESYNYEDYISSIRVMFQPLCNAKHIHLEIKDQGEKPNIFVDKMRYQQIYFNILSNAVKYTPEGGTITYYSELNKIDENNIDCKCHIIDNGIGMSEEFQKKLFKPFMRENQTGYTEVQGTGLGLSIANNIVKMMGGDIKVISKLRQGTEVIVHLPLQLADENESTSVKTVEKDYSILKGKKILLVEDNKLNSEIAKGLLEKKGVKVECAFNGEECIEKFISSKENYYDLILMDIRMPIMDGLEATKSIRLLQRKDANTIPIIAMTANAFDDDVETSKKAGMNAHLTKPIEIEKFYSTIYEYIKQII